MSLNEFHVCVETVSGLFQLRFGFDESHPSLEGTGCGSLSGVGNLMGDRLPFGCLGAVVFVVEGDSDDVVACGVPMGVSEALFWVVRLVPGC